MRQLPRLVLVLILGLLQVACTSVSFRSQELRFDRDPVQDTLTIEVQIEGFAAREGAPWALFSKQGESGTHAEIGAAVVRRMAAGERCMYLFDPNFFWDLDGVGSDAGLTPAQRLYLAGIRMEEARVELDDAGQLRIYQRLVIRDLAGGIELLNQELRREALAMTDKDLDTSELDEHEVASLRVLLADAAAGRDWVRWGDGGLELRVPVTSRHLLSLLRELGDQDVEGYLRKHPTFDEEDIQEIGMGMGALRLLLSVATDLRIEAEHAVLLFGDAEGDLAFSVDLGGPDSGEPYRTELREVLVEQGFTFPSHHALPE